MLNVQCSMFNTQCSILNTQFLMAELRSARSFLILLMNSDGERPVDFLIALKKVVRELKPASEAMPSRVI